MNKQKAILCKSYDRTWDVNKDNIKNTVSHIKLSIRSDIITALQQFQKCSHV